MGRYLFICEFGGCTRYATVSFTPVELSSQAQPMLHNLGASPDIVASSHISAKYM